MEIAGKKPAVYMRRQKTLLRQHQAGNVATLPACQPVKGTHRRLLLQLLQGRQLLLLGAPCIKVARKVLERGRCRRAAARAHLTQHAARTTAQPCPTQLTVHHLNLASRAVYKGANHAIEHTGAALTHAGAAGSLCGQVAGA